MQIDLDLLFTWGAIAKEYKKNEIIYHMEDIPQAIGISAKRFQKLKT